MVTCLSDPPNLLISHLLCMTTMIRSCPAEHSPRLAQFKQLQKEALFCCLTRQKQHYRCLGGVAQKMLFHLFNRLLFCFSSQLPFGWFFCGLFPQECFRPRACFLSVNCSFPLLTHVWVHPRSLSSGSARLFVFFIKQSALFQYNSTVHTIAVTYCRESSSVTCSSSNAGETPLVACLLLLCKAFVEVQLLLFFCVLAPCWHCKSETVAPSGASTTVAPGTVSC